MKTKINKCWKIIGGGLAAVLTPYLACSSLNPILNSKTSTNTCRQISNAKYDICLPASTVFEDELVTGDVCVEYDNSSMEATIVQDYDDYSTYVNGDDLIFRNSIEISGDEYKLTAISDNAFNADEDLRGFLSFNKCTSLTTIGNNAFYDCTEINNVFLPASITSIGDSSFAYSTTASPSLKNISFSTLDNIAIDNLLSNGINNNWLFTNDSTTRSVMVTTITIPNGTKDTYEEAYSESGKTWMTNTGSSGSTLSWKESNPSISASEVFTNDTGNSVLGTVYYSLDDNNYVTIESDDGLGNYTCVTGTNLRLNSTLLGNPIYSIGNDAFAMKNGNNMTGDFDLSQTTNLASIKSNSFYDSLINGKIILPSQSFTIANTAFNGCKYTDFDITGQTYWKIVNAYGAKMLIKASESDWTTAVKAFAIGDVDLTNFNGTIESGFDCTSISSLIYPKSLNYTEAFPAGDCPYLKKIYMYDNVTDCSTDGFCANDISLESVRLSKNLTEVGDGYFMNCSKLQSVVIPEQCTTIGAQAFSLCENLQDITIPAKVNQIDYLVFVVCPNLISITFENPDGAWISGIDDMWLGGLYFTTSVKCIYVPEGSIPSYQEAYTQAEQTWMTAGGANITWKEYTEPDTNTNLNLGIALGVSLGLCVGLPGIVGGICALSYKNKRDHQDQH